MCWTLLAGGVVYTEGCGRVVSLELVLSRTDSSVSKPVRVLLERDSRASERTHEDKMLKYCQGGTRFSKYGTLLKKWTLTVGAPRFAILGS